MLVAAFGLAHRERADCGDTLARAVHGETDGALARRCWSPPVCCWSCPCRWRCCRAQYHVLGTDKVGQDVLYQALKSIRTGLVIGTLTTLVMLPFALLLGIMAGYFRGWVDDVIQYLYTTLNSIPGVLLIAASVLMHAGRASIATRTGSRPPSERADVPAARACA